MKKKFLTFAIIGFALFLVATPLVSFGQPVPAPATPPPTPVAAPAVAGEGAGIIESCGLNLPNCLIKAVTLVITGVMSLLVSLGAWLIELALGFSASVLESPIVKTGFSISLAFSNLVLVIALIVIAVATIIRIESYGMKQILWKLIAIAVVMNFSFVFAGYVISGANSLTDYFITRANPNPLSQNSSFTKYSDFTTSLASGFNPNTLYYKPAPDKAATDWSGYATVAGGGCAAGVAVAGAGCVLGAALAVSLKVAFGGIGNFFTSIMNMVFIIIFTLLIALLFMALALMLILRYVYLSILLILLPLALMVSIFPNFKGQWQKWFQNFVKWTLFAPICIFFIYLALVGVQLNRAYFTNIVHQSVTGNIAQNPSVALGTQMGQSPGFLESVGSMIVVLAMAFGSLFVANSMSITGSKMAYTAGVGGAKGLGNWAYRRGVGVAARTAGAVGGAAAAAAAPGPYTTGWRRILNLPIRGVNAFAGSGAARSASSVVARGQVFGASGPSLFASVAAGVRKGAGTKTKAWLCDNCDQPFTVGKSYAGQVITKDHNPDPCPNCGADEKTAKWQALKK